MPNNINWKLPAKPLAALSARRLIILILLIWYLLLGLFVLTDRDIAAIMLRELKINIEAHFMYGSTPGKAVWFPLFFLLGLGYLEFLNLFRTAAAGSTTSSAFKGSFGSRALAALIIITCLVWLASISGTVDAIKRLGINPYRDGIHVQFCKDGGYYTEVLAVEHSHSLKAIASDSLLTGANFFSGEGFSELGSAIAWPSLALIILSLAIFFILLRDLRHGSILEQLLFISGYYIIFFSFFDGGPLAGIGGIAFLSFPWLGRIAAARRMPALTHAALFAGMFLAVYAFGCLFLLFSLRLTGYQFHSIISSHLFSFYASSAFFSHLSIASLACAAIFSRASRRPAILALVFATALYGTNMTRARAIGQYARTIEANIDLAVFVYSDREPKQGQIIMSTQTSKILLIKNQERISAWNFCRKILDEMEGLSYRSIMVSAYCTPIELKSDAGSLKRLKVKPLRTGTCGFKCDPAISKLFPIQRSNESADNPIYLLTGVDLKRDLGIALCDLGVAAVVSKADSFFGTEINGMTYAQDDLNFE